jgi:hypothetical protein
MKRIIGLTLLTSLLTSLLTFGSAFAENTPDSAAAAAQEWNSYMVPLAPLGERMAAKLTDPDDPQLRQELYRFIYSQIAAGYMGVLYTDLEHPDFLPYFNQAFNQAFPNPDDVYYVAAIEGTGVYKISGFRGTVHIADVQIAGGNLIPHGTGDLGKTFANHDLSTVHAKKDGSFEVILSPERPAGYKGDWWKLDSSATYILVRQISYDWLHETDARVAIERLDRPAIKPRPGAQTIEAQLKQIPVWAETWTRVSIDWIKRVRERGLINKVQVANYNANGGLSTQRYIEGAFDLNADEALIVETEMPKQCRYWNFQLADELWSSVDWMNRQSSLNGYTAKLDKDGKFRAVVSAQDPGVPNWLDNGGLKRGLVYGRWTECSSAPTPTVTKVKVADVRKYLPADTPIVTAEARDATIRLRRKAVQLRRRW